MRLVIFCIASTNNVQTICHARYADEMLSDDSQVGPSPDGFIVSCSFYIVNVYNQFYALISLLHMVC